MWAAAAVAGLVAVAGGALATIGFRHEVGAAVSYHDLVTVVLRWHGRLALWSWIAWVAVAAEAVLLIVWFGRTDRQSVSRLPAAIAALLLVAWVAHFGLAWHSHSEQPAPSGQMSMVPGASAISDSAREATVATGPLFPAYGWPGFIVVLAFAAVIAVMIVRSRRGS